MWGSVEILLYISYVYSTRHPGELSLAWCIEPNTVNNGPKGGELVATAFPSYHLLSKLTVYAGVTYMMEGDSSTHPEALWIIIRQGPSKCNSLRSFLHYLCKLLVINRF